MTVPSLSDLNIRLAVFDFDGVFTDNRVLVDQDGREAVYCWRGDGIGLELLAGAGIEALVISTETNPVVAARCGKLRVPCIPGCRDKWEILRLEIAKRGLDAREVSYLGNDVNDAECLRRVGLPACVADSHPDVLPLAKYVTRKPGGYGAVRELCDYLLSVKVTA